MNTRTWWRFAVATFLALGAAGCSYNKPAPDKSDAEGVVKFFDASARKAFGNYQKELTKRRRPTTLRSQRKNHQITTCTELLELLEAGLSLEKARVDRVFSEYQTCLVLSVLRYGQTARVSYFKPRGTWRTDFGTPQPRDASLFAIP